MKTPFFLLGMKFVKRGKILDFLLETFQYQFDTLLSGLSVWAEKAQESQFDAEEQEQVFDNNNKNTFCWGGKMNEIFLY